MRVRFMMVPPAVHRVSPSSRFCKPIGRSCQTLKTRRKYSGTSPVDAVTFEPAPITAVLVLNAAHSRSGRGVGSRSLNWPGGAGGSRSLNWPALGETPDPGSPRRD